jgi:hypothetical protein
MFPQFGPRGMMGGQPLGQGEPNTYSINMQGNSLMGNAPIQAASSQPNFEPVALNSTAPQSSANNPNVSNMVKALQGAKQ